MFDKISINDICLNNLSVMKTFNSVVILYVINIHVPRVGDHFMLMQVLHNIPRDERLVNVTYTFFMFL